MKEKLGMSENPKGNINYKQNLYDQYVNSINKIPLLTKEETCELFTRLNSENEVDKKGIRSKLINHNLLLVVKYVNQYSCNNSDKMDLIQEGNNGLIVAVDKFDHSLGYNFSTYATFWIKRYIRDGLTGSKNLIRIPKNVAQKHYAIRRMINHYMKMNGTMPSINELVELTGLTIVDIECYFEYNREIIALDKEINEKGQTVDIFLADETFKIEQAIEEKEEQKLFNKAFEKVQISERNKEIVSAYFGLNNQKSCTIMEIAEKYDITKQRVSLILAQAYKVMRKDSEFIKLMKHMGIKAKKNQMVERIRSEKYFSEYDKSDVELMISYLKDYSDDYNELVMLIYNENFELRSNLDCSVEKEKIRAQALIKRHLNKYLNNPMSHMYKIITKLNEDDRLYNLIIANFSEKEKSFVNKLYYTKDISLLNLNNIKEIYGFSKEELLNITKAFLNNYFICVDYEKQRFMEESQNVRTYKKK